MLLEEFDMNLRTTFSLLLSSCAKRRWPTLHHRFLSLGNWDIRVAHRLFEIPSTVLALCILCTTLRRPIFVGVNDD
jgi:hypothetical protein